MENERQRKRVRRTFWIFVSAFLMVLLVPHYFGLRTSRYRPSPRVYYPIGTTLKWAVPIALVVAFWAYISWKAPDE
jgi:hypothetical protein